MFDAQDFRKSFPGLGVQIGNHPLIYFDNAASSLKHSHVIERVKMFDQAEAANVHRGAHSLSHKGTENYEKARAQVQEFVGAASADEIIFTRGTTESVNLVAHGFVSEHLKSGDEILISSFEHHSNIVPWQALAEEKGFHLRVVPLCKEQGFSMELFENSLTEKTKFVSVLLYSNAIGNRLPVEKIVELSHQRDIPVFVDGAQAVLHETMDMASLDADFLAFSGHKMFGPYGIGMLYGKAKHLEAMKPYQYGGSMIDRVQFEKTSFAKIPQKFEAGTPNVSGAIGFGLACDLVRESGVQSWKSHTESLRNGLMDFLKNDDSYSVIDFESEEHTSVVSFVHKQAHASDIGTLLDKYGIAVRAGHHCTQPLMDCLGVPGTVRASFAPYNTQEELNFFYETLENIKDFF